jgi:hypothetical protein
MFFHSFTSFRFEVYCCGPKSQLLQRRGGRFTPSPDKFCPGGLLIACFIESVRGTPPYIVITLQNIPLCKIQIVLEASVWKPLTP